MTSPPLTPAHEIDNLRERIAELEATLARVDAERLDAIALVVAAIRQDPAIAVDVTDRGRRRDDVFEAGF